MLVKLKDVCKIKPGYAFNSNDFGHGAAKCIKITDISFSIQETELINVEENDKLKDFIVNDGDIIMSMTSATQIGKIGKLRKHTHTIYLNQRLCKFEANETKINKDYLFFVLSQNNFNKFIRSSADSKSLQQNISHYTIGEFTFELPNLKIQNKIAKILSNIDNQIERNNTMVKRLQDLATSTYSRWFNQFEFPNKDGLPYKSNNGEFVYSEKLKRNIPIGWEVKKVIDNNVIVGGTPNRDIKEYWNGDIPWIITEMIQNGIIGQPKEYITSLGLNKSATKIIPQNSVIMAMYGKGTAGRIGFLPYKATTNQACCSIYSDNIEETSLLYFFLNSQNQYLNKIITGSIQQNLNKETIGKLYYILPPKDILKKSNLSNYLLNMCVLENETLLLNNLKSKLLPLLINGQLEV